MKAIRSIRSNHGITLVGALAALSLASCAATHDCCSDEAALAATTTSPAAHAQGDVQHQLPPGWTEEDMMACVIAGQPGEMHELLAASTGKWVGTSKMWMAEGTEPMVTECSLEHSMIMEGRYAKTKFSCHMQEVGVFNGIGFAGYDNVEGKFVSCWMDNQSTKIMVGTGEPSDDGKTMTWRYEYTCPIQHKPTSMREVERTTGDSKTLEMFMIDPKTGREFKTMEVSLKRTSDAPHAGS